jgi:enterochelin esterase-like enzyme
MLTQYQLRGRSVDNTRTVWSLPPAVIPARRAPGLVVLLDGEYYTRGIEVPQTLLRLQAEELIPPVRCLFVSHVDAETRWRECPCSPMFAEFLAAELLPWATAEFGTSTVPADRLIGGLSFTGLAAAFTALRHPDAFGKVLCQSASFWWGDEWLTGQYHMLPALPLRFYLSCGDRETVAPVEHRPGVVQSRSQLDDCRAMAETLAAKGYPVRFELFSGGHELPCWERDLPNGLRALLGEP